MKKLVSVVLMALLLGFLASCENYSVSEQNKTSEVKTSSVILAELSIGEPFLDKNLIVTCTGLYGSAKNTYTGQRNLIVSIEVTNTTNFDTRITATQFAATFNGYVVNYVSKDEYVNNSESTATNLIELLPLEGNIPPKSSLLGSISFNVKAADYTKTKFQSIKVYYRGYDGQTKAIWTIDKENVDWNAVQNMDKEK